MTSLTASRLMTIWERGLNQPLLCRTHQLLAAAFPGLDTSTAGSLSIGERDARLLMVREFLFGSALLNLANCPQCGRPVEWEMNTSDIHLQTPREPEPDRSFIHVSEDYEVRFRLPGGNDIQAVSSAEQLLERCVISATRDGKSLHAGQLPMEVREGVSQRMETEDPQADIDLLLDCPYCEHSWNACFDILSYLWEEIHRWAMRMLHSVHLLAKTYHWPEQVILDMSPRRRRMYLQMIDGGE